MTTERLGNCEKCPLNDRPVVPGYGPHGGLAIVGEAPGQNEARRGRPFVGDAGALLREVIRACGHDPDDVYYTNTVVRHPAGNKTPGMTPIRACNDRLHEELGEVQPTKILTAGGVALTGLTKASRVLPITKLRGEAQWVDIGGRQTLLVPTIHPALVLRDPDMFPDLLFDVQKWLKVDAPLPRPEIEKVVVDSYTDLLDYLTALADASMITCDLETYGFHPIRDELLSIGFGAATGDTSAVTVVVPEELVRIKRIRELVWDFFTEVDSRFVFHNAKFDLQFLLHYFGADRFSSVWDDIRMGDTMLLHYLHDERPIGRYLGHSLKAIARTWYDIPDYHWDFDAFYATPKEERDYPALYSYQADDCAHTARLWWDLIEKHTEEAKEDGSPWFDPMRIHDDILVPGAKAFALAEYHGTYIDQAFFTKMGNDLEQVAFNAQKALEVVAGEGFNPGSPAQVRTFIEGNLGDLIHLSVRKGYMRDSTWERRKGTHGTEGRNAQGKAAPTAASTDRETLEAMIRLWGKDDDRSKILQHIIDFRNAQKILQTNVTGILDRVDPDGRIRPSFQLAGTATGRLSCREPNFQNIPAYSEYNVRQGFAAPPGFKFVEADYSQLELRVAAWLSEDPDLIEVFATGKDIHSEVAVAMFNKPADQISSGERYMAKRVDFGILYGRSAKALAEGPEMDYLVDKLAGERWTLEAAELYVRRFLEGFPRLEKWMKETGDGALRNQWVDTPLGRRRRFPYITRALVGHTRRQAVNTPIQSVASDLTLQALIRISGRVQEFGGKVLFSVHDSIAMEVPEDNIDLMEGIVRYEMEENISIDPKGIPFKCDIEVGANWGTALKIGGDPTIKEAKAKHTMSVEGRPSGARPVVKRGGGRNNGGIR